MTAPLVVTTLLTAHPDPQRGEKWTPDFGLVETLAWSVVCHGGQLVVLVDEPDGYVIPEGLTKSVVISPGVDWTEHTNPYFARWEAIALALHIFNGDAVVWAVDATDVELLRPPTSLDPSKLYVGSEPPDCPDGLAWLNGNHRGNFDLPFLHNAGILGARASVLVEFCNGVLANGHSGDLTDMGAIQRTVAGIDTEVVTGLPVHTRFKGLEHNHPTAWWRHK